jgi:Phosphate-selective porin O and P
MVQLSICNIYATTKQHHAKFRARHYVGFVNRDKASPMRNALLTLPLAALCFLQMRQANAQERGSARDTHSAHSHPDVSPHQAAHEGAPKLRAKFGEGIGVESADGSFGFNLKGRAQIRTTLVAPEDGKDASVDMQVRRLRLTLDGFALKKKMMTFKIQLAMANLDLDPVAPYIVRDAYANFAISRDFELRAGQMKVPYGRQRVVSSGSLQMADRSVVTGEFNLDRDVGLSMLSTDFLGKDGLLAYNMGIFGGDGRGRVSGGYGLLYAGRVELRALGGPRLAFGLSGAVNHKTDRQRSTVGPVYATGPWATYAHTGLDWAFKWSGLSVTGEAFLRRALEDSNTRAVEGKTVNDKAHSGYGGFLQAGKFIGKHAEFSGRVGATYGLGALGSRAPKQRELGGGFSYYFEKHALKVQADYFYLFENWTNGKHQVRLQLQFAP